MAKKLRGFILHTRTGVYWYRRAYPRDIARRLGRSEFAVHLGTDRDAALVAYHRAAEEFERHLRDQRQPDLTRVESLLDEFRRDRFLSYRLEIESRREWENRVMARGPDPRDPIPDLDIDLPSDLRAWATRRRLNEDDRSQLEGLAIEAFQDEFPLVSPQDAGLVEKAPPRAPVRAVEVVATLVAHPVAASSATSVAGQVDDFAGLMPDAHRTYRDMLEIYLERTSTTEKTADQYRVTFRRLEELVGPKPVASLSPLDVESFYQSLVDTPSGKGDGTLSYDTIYRAISNIRSFYRWCEARHLARDNPARKIQIERPEDDDEDAWKPYTPQGLQAIIDGLAPLDRDHRYWFALVGLFSGMRLSEIAQLEFPDLIDLNGRKHFDVNRRSSFGHQKSTKTKSSIRQIPVAPDLIRLGFLDWVESRRSKAPNGLIFPDYRYSRWWNVVFLADIGLKPYGHVFHSLRKNFRIAMTAATESTEIIDRFMGHYPRGMGAERYGARLLQPHESAVIDRFGYPGLRLDSLLPK